MTTETPGDRHLSEEELSERLDRSVDAGAGASGAAGAGAAGAGGAGASDATFVTRSDSHLAACDRCRAQLGALERARAALRAPVATVDPAVRATAIATVLAAAPAAEAQESPEPPGARGAEGAGAGGAPPTSPPPPSPVPISTGRRPWVTRIGAAAAVVALAVGLTVAALHGSPTGKSTASGPAHSAASGRVPATSVPVPFTLTFGPLATSSDQSQSAASSVRALGSLGPVDSAASLRAALSPSATGATPGPEPMSAVAASTTTPMLGNAASTPTNSPSSESVYGSVASADASAFQRCLSGAYDAVQSARPVGALEQLATARYRGEPALVYVFAASGAGSDGKGVVVAVRRDGCQVLAKTAL